MSEAATYCEKCELAPCRCGELLTFYSIYSREVGSGPLHRELSDAELEREEMYDDYPDDVIDICTCKMLAEDYVKLPEHQGY